jgi:hypothetical protein
MSSPFREQQGAKAKPDVACVLPAKRRPAFAAPLSLWIESLTCRRSARRLAPRAGPLPPPPHVMNCPLSHSSAQKRKGWLHGRGGVGGGPKKERASKRARRADDSRRAMCAHTLSFERAMSMFVSNCACLSKSLWSTGHTERSKLRRYTPTVSSAVFLSLNSTIRCRERLTFETQTTY